jgi:hypothetical protein
MLTVSLISISELSVENVGSLTSRNPCGYTQSVTGIALHFTFTRNHNVINSIVSFIDINFLDQISVRLFVF